MQINNYFWAKCIKCRKVVPLFLHRIENIFYLNVKILSSIIT